MAELASHIVVGISLREEKTSGEANRPFNSHKTRFFLPIKTERAHGYRPKSFENVPYFCGIVLTLHPAPSKAHTPPTVSSVAIILK